MHRLSLVLSIETGFNTGLIEDLTTYPWLSLLCCCMQKQRRFAIVNFKHNYLDSAFWEKEMTTIR
eukprot:scaffold32821_cov58-Attheya_sp.AAC.1